MENALANQMRCYSRVVTEKSNKMEDELEISEITSKFGLDDLHPYQKDAIAWLKRKDNVFVCQKTGKGKSLCYQAYTTVSKNQESMVLVVSPLISIMEEQVTFLNSLGITAGKLCLAVYQVMTHKQRVGSCDICMPLLSFYLAMKSGERF